MNSINIHRVTKVKESKWKLQKPEKDFKFYMKEISIIQDGEVFSITLFSDINLDKEKK